MSTIVITGASGGLGRQTAAELAAMGNRLLLVVRDQAKGHQVAADLAAGSPGVSVEVLTCDLADLNSVRSFAAQLVDRGEPIDTVIGNAGVQVVDGLERSADGYELTFAVNHLAHFLLVTELLGQLRRPARVIMVASGVHLGPSKSYGFPAPEWAEPRQLALADRVGTKTTGRAGRVRYANSKLANIMFAYELARRVAEDDVTVNAFDPGLMPETGLARQYPPAIRQLYRRLTPLLTVLPGAHRVADSAADLAWLATAPELAGMSGKYFVRRQPRPSSRPSYDQDLARELWEQSMVLVEGTSAS
ncbi:MAG: SDR family NAD(P)-dependent oxidoreductase [Microlunatus sp.]